MNEDTVKEEKPENEIVPETKQEEPKLTPEKVKAHNIYIASLIFKGGLQGGGSSKVGITRKVKAENKKSQKQAKLSRKINRKIASKKFRPTGNKNK